MTITREQLEKAALAAGIDVVWRGDDLCPVFRRTKTKVFADIDNPWQPHIDHGQLLDLAMVCKIVIHPLLNEIWYFVGGVDTSRKVNCQDFPAFAEAVILAACEQFGARSVVCGSYWPTHKTAVTNSTQQFDAKGEQA